MVFFICLAFVLCSFGGLIYTATVVAATVSKSGYTQAHGLPRSGIVTSVTNHHDRVGSADVGVRLGEPVNGQAVTTAHLHSLTSLEPGAAVRVLVDPKDPGYAEFPGQRYAQNSEAQAGAITFLACLAFFSFAAAWWGRVWYRQHKRSADGRILGTDADGAYDLSINVHTARWLSDPVVLAHARTLLTSHETGATEYIAADLRDVEAGKSTPWCAVGRRR